MEAGRIPGAGRRCWTFLFQHQLIEYVFLTWSWVRVAVHKERVALALTAFSLDSEGLMTSPISGRREPSRAAETAATLLLRPMWDGTHTKTESNPTP